MADFLKAVESVRTQGQNDGPALTPVGPASRTSERAIPTSEEENGLKFPKDQTKRLSSSEDVLQVLRDQPDSDGLLTVLKLLQSPTFQADFNIYAPGPRQAQIISTLLNNIVPNFWSTSRQSLVLRLVPLFKSVAGLNAIIARLRLLSSEARPSSNAPQSAPRFGLQDVMDLATQVVNGDSTLDEIWTNLQHAVPEKLKRDIAWREVVNLLGSGKVLSTLAQAEDRLRDVATTTVPHAALAKGGEYAAWLGRNIATLACAGQGPGCDVAAAQVLAKSLHIGYPNQLLDGLLRLLTQLNMGADETKAVMLSLIRNQPAQSKRIFMEQLLRWLSALITPDSNEQLPSITTQSEDVASSAALVSAFAGDGGDCREALMSYLKEPTLSGLLSFTVRRASIATIAGSTDTDDIHSILEASMSTFNDPILIAHAPLMQQEALAQSLLLVAGYLHRASPMALLMTARSSNHMQGVSNRLDSSNARARWLGMVVGTAISGLVDKEGMRMSFGTSDMETDEAKWYAALAHVEDHIGQLSDFGRLLDRQRKTLKCRPPSPQQRIEVMPTINGKPMFGPLRPPAQTEIIGDRVTEVFGDDAGGNLDDGEELRPYAKPDSDPEDSDEDATLVNRKKAKPPVYIRDLMAMLRADQDHDRFQLGIKHAAGLIRRKTTFGTEVKDHAEEIGVILCNLHNPFDFEDFEQMRLQAMIATILSDVQTMAPWFCKQAFVGEYSIAQRCAILSAIGLGGRELAGFKDEDELNPNLGISDFPSKRLPPRLHAIYDTTNNASSKRLEAASQDVEHALVQPLALQAADQSTAHLNAVKVRTFSSRMNVERTKRRPAVNALAKVFGSAFFAPLINSYQQEIAAYGLASVYSSVPIVLITYIKTVALLLHAAGPATLGLSELSGEFWELLLSLRVQALQDITVLHAVLFSLLMVLELNTDKRRIVNDHPKRLMETQQWVDVVFDRMGGNELVSEDGSNIETKVRTLAAGVLVRAKEIIEAYQKDLVGYSLDY